MSVFANHVHLFPDWMRPDGTLTAFRRAMDAVGIDRAVLFAPFPHRWEEAGGEVAPGAWNRWLAEEIAGKSEFVGYGTVDFREGAPPMAEQVRQVAELGLRGLKVHPAVQSFPIDGATTIDACAAAGAHGLVVSWHTGVHHHALADDHPVLLDNVIRAAPETRMVFEHAGGWHYYRDVVAVIQNNRHGKEPAKRFAGITTVLDKVRFRGWYLGPEVLAELRWQLGEDSLIYGTDFPHNDAQRIAQDLAIIREMDWPAEAVGALLGGNLQNVLGAP
ncbi:MAG TPA: amidohydrolase family protein [Chloroflexota bacterium]|nr:amidohydrolase family protein [Chloroflexota bacterium]